MSAAQNTNRSMFQKFELKKETELPQQRFCPSTHLRPTLSPYGRWSVRTHWPQRTLPSSACQRRKSTAYLAYATRDLTTHVSNILIPVFINWNDRGPMSPKRRTVQDGRRYPNHPQHTPIHRPGPTEKRTPGLSGCNDGTETAKTLFAFQPG